jgi:hypothetical protein
MRTRGPAVTAATLGLIGLVLVVIESIQALRGVALSTLDLTLLYVGLGACVIAAAVTLANTDASGPVAASDSPGGDTAAETS